MNHFTGTMVLLGCAMVALATCAKSPVASRSSILEIPFEDVGACPFECCTYRAWTASEATATVLPTPSIAYFAGGTASARLCC
jgi:hypothetical protein